MNYLSVCWSKGVFDGATAGVLIPEAALREAERRAHEVRDRIAFAGRTLHRWSGDNLASDTQALADAVAGAAKDLYRVDETLVRVVKSAAVAERTRRIYGYEGRPKDLDAARLAGHRLMPILPTDTEALRELIADNVAAEFTKDKAGSDKNKASGDAPAKDKAGGDAAPAKRIGSFGFKAGSKIHIEPDAGVLKHLLKRELPSRVRRSMALSPPLSCRTFRARRSPTISFDPTPIGS